MMIEDLADHLFVWAIVVTVGLETSPKDQRVFPREHVFVSVMNAISKILWLHMDEHAAGRIDSIIPEQRSGTQRSTVNDQSVIK